MSLYCEVLTALVLTLLFVTALSSFGIQAVLLPFAVAYTALHYLAIFVPIFIIVFLMASLGELALKAIFRGERRVAAELVRTDACKTE